MGANTPSPYPAEQRLIGVEPKIQMVQLFLSKPTWNSDGNDEHVQHRSLLDNLDSILWSVMSSGSRSEVRLWLCNTLSGISSISPRQQCELFVNLLKSSPQKRGLAAQILRIIFEKYPKKAGAILSQKGYMLENFFRGNPRRIMLWFSNFSGSPDLEHRLGAKALSQFAFVNRDICWEELVWKGKRGQSPAMVATKPHYFVDLDVQQTVENFLEYVPEFWSSEEFAESLRDGEILLVDAEFFVDLFVDLIYKENLLEMWKLINEFLVEESFSFLSKHLLIILEEQDLRAFLDLLCKFLQAGIQSVDFGNSSLWLENLLSLCGGYGCIDELLLLNALISRGRQLLRLVNEEDHQDEKEKIKDIMLQICAFSRHANSFTPILKECFRKKNLKPIKYLGLQSWVLHYRLSEECHTPESWESLFISNGINFRKSGKYLLLHHDRISEESESDLEGASVRVKRKKKEKRRTKRRRNLSNDDTYDNEPLDFDLMSNRLGLQSKAANWLLSTDDYSTAWSSADLPEHLAKYCFLTWMKWVFAKWRDLD